MGRGVDDSRQSLGGSEQGKERKDINLNEENAVIMKIFQPIDRWFLENGRKLHRSKRFCGKGRSARGCCSRDSFASREAVQKSHPRIGCLLRKREETTAGSIEASCC